MKCKNCGVEMIVPNFSLLSDISKLTGDYCSRKCIELKREEQRNEPKD